MRCFKNHCTKEENVLLPLLINLQLSPLFCILRSRFILLSCCRRRQQLQNHQNKPRQRLRTKPPNDASMTKNENHHKDEVSWPQLDSHTAESHVLTIFGCHVKFPLPRFLGYLCAALFTTAIFPDSAWRQHNKHARWVWRQQQWGKQGQAMIDGYRFLEENRLTEHASVWQRSAQRSSQGNSLTLDQSCLLHFFHVALNIP